MKYKNDKAKGEEERKVLASKIFEKLDVKLDFNKESIPMFNSTVRYAQRLNEI